MTHGEYLDCLARIVALTGAKADTPEGRELNDITNRAVAHERAPWDDPTPRRGWKQTPWGENVKHWPTNTWLQNRLRKVRSNKNGPILVY